MSDHLYRIVRLWGGQWLHGEWTSDFEAVAQEHERLMQSGKWTMLTIERDDGACRAGRCASWYTDHLDGDTEPVR